MNNQAGNSDDIKGVLVSNHSGLHVREATPTLLRIVDYGFRFLSTGSGIAIVVAVIVPHVFPQVSFMVPLAIAFILLSVLIGVFLVKSVLSMIYKLAALPDDRSPKVPKTIMKIHTKGGSYVGGNVSTGNFVGRDSTEENGKK